MQLPTHLTAGILIQILVSMLYPSEDLIFLSIVFILAFLSHFFIDALAIMTYHPPEVQNTIFWKYWHIFVYGTSFFIIIGALLINPLFAVGMIGANLVDLWDWVLLRAILKSENKKLYIHKYVNVLRNPIKPYVPDMTYSHYGIIPEFFLILVVLDLFLTYFIG